MSDLQCAARLFVARHGEAEYESGFLSDHGGSLTRTGRHQARELADALAGQRLARVWTSSMARAVQTAEIVAARLGVDVVVREGLREIGVGDHAGTIGDPDPLAETFAAWAGGDLEPRVAGAECGKEVVDRVCGVLEEVADAHRGESALVISHGGAICCAVPYLATNLRSDHALDAPLAHCAVIELDGDADGWVARSWAGQPL
ncbi:histidine phosphatase family protein [Nocardioides seonyuensis]|uniref:Histidine phosphatase family protein n=1 Tax=Nocardioides seonyuensis TaxID=2518371 RepID=A0A4P7IGX3_9ACTN|nr:histidine phosphatase family protein [Nocardioides seonyuensis]QBX56518.1 histidine phosphatase family protein [Nocardioides seonyuensis]